MRTEGRAAAGVSCKPASGLRESVFPSAAACGCAAMGRGEAGISVWRLTSCLWCAGRERKAARRSAFQPASGAGYAAMDGECPATLPKTDCLPYRLLSCAGFSGRSRTGGAGAEDAFRQGRGLPCGMRLNRPEALACRHAGSFRLLPAASRLPGAGMPPCRGALGERQCCLSGVWRPDFPGSGVSGAAGAREMQARGDAGSRAGQGTRLQAMQDRPALMTLTGRPGHGFRRLYFQVSGA